MAQDIPSARDEPASGSSLIDSHERVYVGAGDPANLALHIERYKFAASRVAAADRVIDAASGSGYGSQLLSHKAQEVIGLDLNTDALDYARSNHQERNITYHQCDLDTTIPYGANSFDMAVCFETLEHVTNQADLLREFSRILRPTGTLILSTPDRRMYSDVSRYHNPFHVHEFSKEELLDQVAECFAIKEIYGQVRYRSSRLGEAVFSVARLDILNLRRFGFRAMSSLRRAQRRLSRFRIELDGSNLERIERNAPPAHLFLVVVAAPKRWR
jgi:ubiquinone/menaquinone biosynthesis C-methylase UbiE